jgi:hypothetical protein
MTRDNATQSSARADRVSDQFSDYSPAERPMLRQLQDIGTSLWQMCAASRSAEFRWASIVWAE